MIIIKKYLFILFFALIVVSLLLFSLVFRETTHAITAQVEPMKMAVSYHKAVKIIEIYVMAGQTVQPGDLLVKVERPDLRLDVEKKNNDIARLELERALAASKFAAKQMQQAIEKDADLRKLDGEVEQLKIIERSNRQLSDKFGKLTGMNDSSRSSGGSYYEVQLGVLTNQRELVLKQYQLETSASRQVHDEEMKNYEILAGQLQKELEMLLLEESELVKKAGINGTVGSVNAQTGELLSPYSTILSIYESNPTVIKAVMNEGYKYEMEVGKGVTVESTNRSYSIEGKVTEIGSRIIEYPSRLKSNQNIQMWGQEVFIKIPENNKFLNGERVFVIIKN
ncbi:MAG: HlyD family efflux transporter periplasmic adaptor subunit [Cyclobacteriaceae bacterium]|nr:HlyD family efflux transporter periplasmic adaptor subunit [Cyclobacteriaceae bacterium]